MSKKIKREKYNLKKIFPSSKSMGQREWGKEDLLTIIPKTLSLKKIIIKKGKKGGLQYHRKKNECGYLIKGKLLVRYVSKKNGKLKKKILLPGSVFHFPPGFIHQEEAITNCEIIEASSPHFNDRVRVEKNFGLTVSGLPTTKSKEIITK
jgi:mannose-6-phosphate isomerase-like protein (cupin superfamily)